MNTQQYNMNSKQKEKRPQLRNWRLKKQASKSTIRKEHSTDSIQQKRNIEKTRCATKAISD
jgi:hypothetical protein